MLHSLHTSSGYTAEFLYNLLWTWSMWKEYEAQKKNKASFFFYLQTALSVHVNATSFNELCIINIVQQLDF